MLHVEVAMNKRKAITVNPYASEVYNFKECLNAKHPDWEEFVLNTQKKQLKQHFVKIGDRLIKVSKNKDLMHLTVYLDKNFPKWTRFIITKGKYNVISWTECMPGMLIRTNTSRTSEYVLVKDVTNDEKAGRKITGNQEGKEIIYDAKSCKKNNKFSVLMDEVDTNNWSTIF